MAKSTTDHGKNNIGVVATKREVEAPSETLIPLSSVSGGASTSQTTKVELKTNPNSWRRRSSNQIHFAPYATTPLAARLANARDNQTVTANLEFMVLSKFVSQLD